jgi:hypothetical protein
MKRYENQWSWVTLSVDTSNQNIHFYLNGKESDARHGTGTESPLHYDNRLKSYGLEDWFIGTTTSVGKNEVNRWFKGDIANVKIWNRALSSNEIENLHKDFSLDGLKLHYDFNNSEQINSPYTAIDFSGNGTHGTINKCEQTEGEIKIPYTIIPHRIPGRLRCLPHKDEGLVNIGGVDKWAKGETTARNERRYVLQMQQGEWDYKSDGINSLKYDLVSIEEITPSAKMINVKL